jgi:hypothetical protein
MAHSYLFHSLAKLQITITKNATASIVMILSSIFWSATSLSTHGSGKLPEIAKFLATAVRVALERLRHDDEFCLDFSTVLVGIGVFLEYFEIRHELREKTGPFKIHRPEMPKWMVWAGFAGWLMIVVGVAGEFVFESAVSTRSEELESVSNALLGDAQLAAAEATSNSATANERARKNESAAAQLRIDNLALDIDLQREERRTAEALKGVASANKQAADAAQRLNAELQRTARLEEELSWRTVTVGDKLIIESNLSLYVPPHTLFSGLEVFRETKLEFEYSSGDSEAGEYAQELADTLRNALKGSGAEVGDAISVMGFSSGRPFTGLSMTFNDNTKIQATKLRQAFGAAGVKFAGDINSRFEDGRVLIFVGGKPKPR